EELKDRILTKVRSRLALKTTEISETTDTGKFRLRWTVGIAATVLFAISIGIYLWYGYSGKNGNELPLAKHDVLPGGNRATLTLADGRTIALSSEQSGIIVDDQIRYEGGELIAGF